MSFLNKIRSLWNVLYMPAVFILLVYPLLLGVAACFYVSIFAFSYFEALLIIFGYYVLNIAVGVGLHRYWSHGSFKLHKSVEVVLAFLTAATLQGPILMWASDHSKHHSHTDTEFDPHSPIRFGGRILGFLWAHIGWMLVRENKNKDIDRATVKKLSRSRVVMLQFKYYWWISILMNTAVPVLIGFAFIHSYQGAIAGFVFLGIGRALQQHGTFFINSVTHYFGKREYDKSTAGDIFWMAPFLLGENWHSFHHAFPSDYRNGFKWYQFDVHKWIIYLLGKVGLAWDLTRTSDIRIIAQRKFIIGNSFNSAISRWSILKEKAAKDGIASRLTKSTQSVHNTIAMQYAKYDKKLLELYSAITSLINSEELSKSLIRDAKSLLINFEKNIKVLERKMMPL